MKVTPREIVKAYLREGVDPGWVEANFFETCELDDEAFDSFMDTVDDLLREVVV